jgi:16S rRNA (guanine966-N2)-methyltransferase
MTHRRTYQHSTMAPAKMANRLRIIGGRWRGVRIDFPPLPTLRPSPDRVRETLFNWLQPVMVGARCLDLFAGSGALGIEALSRGAAQVMFVDSEPQVGRHLQATIERLQIDNARLQVADALRFLRGPAERFDIVFLDPPFASGVLEEVCERLTVDGWLAPGAYVYLECPADTPLPTLPANWTVHRTKRAGQVGYHLLHATMPSLSTT